MAGPNVRRRRDATSAKEFLKRVSSGHRVPWIIRNGHSFVPIIGLAAIHRDIIDRGVSRNRRGKKDRCIMHESRVYFWISNDSSSRPRIPSGAAPPTGGVDRPIFSCLSRALRRERKYGRLNFSGSGIILCPSNARFDWQSVAADFSYNFVADFSWWSRDEYKVFTNLHNILYFGYSTTLLLIIIWQLDDTVWFINYLRFIPTSIYFKPTNIFIS